MYSPMYPPNDLETSIPTPDPIESAGMELSYMHYRLLILGANPTLDPA